MNRPSLSIIVPLAKRLISNFFNQKGAIMLLVNQALDILIDGITNLNKPYACDIHHYLYNSEPHYHLRDWAENDLLMVGVFDSISIITNYEQSNFGEVFTDIADPIAIANMLIYIIGKELLTEIYGDTEFFNQKWDEQLSDDDLECMLALAQEWADTKSHKLDDIWASC